MIKRFHLFNAVFCVIICVVSTFALRAEADEYQRQAAIDIQHYRFTLTLSDESDEIRGQAEITIRFTDDGAKSFFLDLTNIKGNSGSASAADSRGMVVDKVVQKIKQSQNTEIDNASTDLSFEHHDNHLVIHTGTPTPKKGEERIYIISYHGIPDDGLIIRKTRSGLRTFFSDHFPNRARHYLPMIDHPHDKATSEFIINAPAHYRVISNGVEIKDQVEEKNGMERTHWIEDKPISTYLMVIGVADFTVRQEPAFTWRGKEIPITTWVYKEDEESGINDFVVTSSALKYFSENFGPYPFRKLANVESSTKWGGMENASCIFYPARAVASDRSIDNTVVHEIVHQWFGDAVTISDWNHVWLSEGFATYFTHVYNEVTYGRERAVEGLKRDRERVIQYDKAHPGIAVVDAKLGPDEILSPLTYQKAGWVLHMLRRRIRDGAFWQAIGQFYRKNRFDNVTTDDFLREVNLAYGQPLDWFFDQWIMKPGHPIVEGSWTFDEASHSIHLNLKQVQKEQPVFLMKIDVAVIGRDGKESNRVTMRMTTREQSFLIEGVQSVTRVVLDPDTWLLFENHFESESK